MAMTASAAAIAAIAGCRLLLLLLLAATLPATTTKTTTAAFSFHPSFFSPSSSRAVVRTNDVAIPAAFGCLRRVSLSSSSSSFSEDADGIGEISSNSNSNSNSNKNSSGNRKNDDNDSMQRFLDELRQRTSDLQTWQAQTKRNWLQAKCVSSIGLIGNDWVRRLAMDSAFWPLVAVGSASGHVYLGNLETSTILASSSSSSSDDEGLSLQDEDDDEEESSQQLEGLDRIVRMLYGGFDGGGTLAIAFHGESSLICESGRHGGVHVWRYDSDAVHLVSQGEIPCLQNTVVTALQIQHHQDSSSDDDDSEDDHDYLWVATGDGRLLSFDLSDENRPLAMQTRAIREFNFGQQNPILSFALCPPLGLAAVSTAAGSVHLVSLLVNNNDQTKDKNDPAMIVAASFTPPFDSSVRRSANSYPLSVAFVQCSSSGGPSSTSLSSTSSSSWSVACGGNDGSIFLQPLNLVSGDSKKVNLQQPLIVNDDKSSSSSLISLLPRHLAPVTCLTSHPLVPGLLISAGQDGTIRVWNVASSSSSSSSQKQPQQVRDCLYQMTGYKVWLGSLWTDGRRLVSDGSDNTIIVHDFGAMTNNNSSLQQNQQKRPKE